MKFALGFAVVVIVLMCFNASADTVRIKKIFANAVFEPLAIKPSHLELY